MYNFALRGVILSDNAVFLFHRSEKFEIVMQQICF